MVFGFMAKLLVHSEDAPRTQRGKMDKRIKYLVILLSCLQTNKPPLFRDPWSQQEPFVQGRHKLVLLLQSASVPQSPCSPRSTSSHSRCARSPACRPPPPGPTWFVEVPTFGPTLVHLRSVASR